MSAIVCETSSATALHLPTEGLVATSWLYGDDEAGVGTDRVSPSGWMKSNANSSSLTTWGDSTPIIASLISTVSPHWQRLRAPHPAAQPAAVMPWRLNLSANSLFATSAAFTAVDDVAHTALFACLYSDRGTVYATLPNYVRSAEAESLMDKIVGFRSLPSNWAGDETELVTQDAVDAAAIAIDAADAAGLPLPSPSPSADGEIGLTWFSGRDRLALTVTRDMHMVWVTSIDRKIEEGQDVEIGSRSLSGLLVEALRGFYKQDSGPVPLSQRR